MQMIELIFNSRAIIACPQLLVRKSVVSGLEFRAFWLQGKPLTTRPSARLWNACPCIRLNPSQFLLSLYSFEPVSVSFVLVFIWTCLSFFCPCIRLNPSQFLLSLYSFEPVSVSFVLIFVWTCLSFFRPCIPLNPSQFILSLNSFEPVSVSFVLVFIWTCLSFFCPYIRLNLSQFLFFKPSP